MLKALILLECDTCHALLGNAANANKGADGAWIADANALERNAERGGWHIWRSKHTCDTCVIEAHFAQEQANA